MASKQGSKRLMKEYQIIQQNSVPCITAHPSEENILVWYYVIEGPPDTPFFGGQYFGTLTFPSEYPYKPPAIRMITPSGRFQCNTRLCFSMSDYHPKTWNPSWQVSTILTGLLSFITSDEVTSGSISSSITEKTSFARRSRAWNNMNKKFIEEFAYMVQENAKYLQQKLIEEDEIQRKKSMNLELVSKESILEVQYFNKRELVNSFSFFNKWAVFIIVVLLYVTSRFTERL